MQQNEYKKNWDKKKEENDWMVTSIELSFGASYTIENIFEFSQLELLLPLVKRFG